MLTFGGTDGLMVGRMGWFHAGSKGMVQCWVEGMMLGQRGLFDALLKGWFNAGMKG
jgi:hypothetical protein